MSGMDGLSRKDQSLYEKYLNAENGNEAKNYTLNGGSLDKLTEVAAKALKNEDLNPSTRERIKTNLHNAIQGKREYYQSSKKGRLIERLRNTPLLSKLIKDSPIEKAENIAAQRSENITPEHSEEQVVDKTIYNEMYEHYMKQIDYHLETLQEALKKPESEDKQISMIYKNQLPKNIPEKWKAIKSEIKDIKSQIEVLQEKRKDLADKRAALSEQTPANFKAANYNIIRDLNKIQRESSFPIGFRYFIEGGNNYKL